MLKHYKSITLLIIVNFLLYFGGPLYLFSYSSSELRLVTLPIIILFGMSLYYHFKQNKASKIFQLFLNILYLLFLGINILVGIIHAQDIDSLLWGQPSIPPLTFFIASLHFAVPIYILYREIISRKKTQSNLLK